MVTVLLPSAKEARGMETLKIKNNNIGSENRFITTPCRKYPVFRQCHIRTSRFYHADFLKAIFFTKESELQIAFSCKSGYG